MAGARNRTIKVTVIGDAKQLKTAFGGAGAAVGKLQNKMAALFGIMAAKRGLKAIVEMGTTFEKNMAKITGLVGISQKDMAGWKEAIMQTSKEFARSPAELSNAMFFITSAGLRGQTALDALNVSAKASAAGLGDTRDIAFAVVSSINAYGKENMSAAQATDVLVATVREGNLEASDLADVMGRVIPISANMGVSLNEVGAAIAVMTRQGADAAQSVTNLRGIFRVIAKPSKQAERALRDYGLSAVSLREQLEKQGLLSVLKTLNGVFADNESAFTKVFGRMQGMIGFQSIMGASTADNIKLFERMADVTGITDDAFGAMADTSAFKMEQAFNELKIAGTNLGLEVLPDIAKAVTDIVPKLAELIPQFAELVVSGVEMAAAFTELLGPAFTAVGEAMRGMGLAAGAVTDVFKLSGLFGEGAQQAQNMATRIDIMNKSFPKMAGTVKGVATVMVDLNKGNMLTTENLAFLQEAWGLNSLEMRNAAVMARDVTGAWAMTDAELSRFDDTVTEAAFGQEDLNAVTDKVTAANERYVLSLLTGADASGDAEEAILDETIALEDEAAAAEEAARAERDRTAALREAADPAFAAVNAMKRMLSAEAKLEEVRKDKKSTLADITGAELDFAEAILNAARANETFSSGDVKQAIRNIAQALGITEDAARDLLATFGILDGTTAEMTVVAKAPIISYDQRGDRLVPRRTGNTALARGGIISRRTIIGGEAGEEAVIPLNKQGVTVLADAMRKAIGAGGPASAGNAQGGGGGPITIVLELDGEVLATKIVNPMARALRDNNRARRR